MSLKALFRDSRALAFDLASQEKLLLFLLFAIGAGLSISVENTLAGLPKNQDSGRWVLQLTLGFWDMFEGIALILILAHSTPQALPLDQPLFCRRPLQRPFLGSFIAEYLRLLAQVILWGLLLIVPGFVRYCRLVFVPMIALFSSDYRAGKVDALQLSHQLSQGRMPLIVATIFGTTALQVVLEFLPQMHESLHALPVRLSVSLLAFSIAVWTYSFLFLIFKHALEEYKWN